MDVKLRVAIEWLPVLASHEDGGPPHSLGVVSRCDAIEAQQVGDLASARRASRVQDLHLGGGDRRLIFRRLWPKPTGAVQSDDGQPN